MESFMGDLSACETMIMKVIWDAKEDIALQDLIRELADRYKKNYARTTVVTFVHKIVDKGFATTYRKGKRMAQNERPLPPQFQRRWRMGIFPASKRMDHSIFPAY